MSGESGSLTRQSTRKPLSQDQRQAISGRGGTNLMAPHDCPVDLLSCPGAGARGLVYVQVTIDEGDGFTPDEARRFAAALLALADHAEYGSGEWWNGEWRSDPAASDD